MTTKKKNISLFIFILIVAIIAAFFDFGVPDNFPAANILNAREYKLGLDLKGGAHLVYEADMSDIPARDRDSLIQGVRDVIERRVNAIGISEPVVQTNKTTNGNYRIIVELAGVFDVNEAIQMIGETPLLEFKELDESAPQSTQIDNEKEEEIRKKAEEVLQRALNGEDFAALAEEFSEDPGSRDKGGDLGFVSRGVFVEEFDNVLFNEDFKEGEVWPELVKSPFGWHIIKKENERTENGEKQIRARHILFSTASAAQQTVEWKDTELTGRYLKRAEVLFNPATGEPEVGVEFNKEGRELFKEITARNIGKPVAIFLDGQIISTPVVQQEITGGRAVITGQFTVKEAQKLAQRLNAGALPVPITLISQQTVGASLGQDALSKSIKAGILGLIVVSLFMILFYRLPGVISVIVLAIYSVLLLAVFKLIGITLTLAGVAGFILSLGLAVDANVLIFERMKEELRDGKSFDVAVEDGFKRAWTSIRDSNVSSILTALILYWFGTSLIKGFAITLTLGILLSMFSAIVITRMILRFVPHQDKMMWFYGVSKKSIKSIE